MFRVLFLVFIPIFMFSKTVINSKTVHYDIYPESKEDLKRALFAKTPIILGGRKYLGVTRWDMNLEYEAIKKDNRCKAINIKTVTKILIILPRIAKGHKTSYNTKSSFRIFYNKVKKHEHKHEYYIIQAAKEIDRKINKIKIQDNCIKLKEKFDKEFNKIIKKYNKKNERFDDETVRKYNPNAELDSYIH